MDTKRINPYHISDVAELSIAGAARVLTGAAAPTSAPDFIGQLYARTSNDSIYIAFGTTPGDWDVIAANKFGGSLVGSRYRIPITVNNSGDSTLTDYQFTFSIDTSALVAAGHMQASGADCRIADVDGNLIPFWNETPFDAADTKIWAKASTLAIGDNIFYMYYGNAEAFSVSSGDATFKFFDDFDERAGEWTPYSGNPILSPEGSEELIVAKSVLKVGTVFYMYYGYTYNGHRAIGRATSSDGKNWTKDSVNNPVMTVGNPGTWDEYWITMPNVWKEGSTWYMLYYGRKSATSPRNVCVGLATSDDGYTWVKEATNPVLEGDIGEWDEDQVEPSDIIKVQSTYYLWYYAMPRRIGVATSTDLINWTKDPNNPIFTAGDFDPSVFKRGDSYYMMVGSEEPKQGNYQLYRDSSPTFYATDRKWMGTIRTRPRGAGWSEEFEEHLFVATDSINKASYTISSDELWCYFSAYTDAVAFNVGLLIEADFDDAVKETFVNWNLAGGSFTANDSILKLSGFGENKLLIKDTTFSISEAIRIKHRGIDRGTGSLYFGDVFAVQGDDYVITHRGKLKSSNSLHEARKNNGGVWSGIFGESYSWSDGVFYVLETQWGAIDEINFVLNDNLRGTASLDEPWTIGDVGIRHSIPLDGAGLVDWALIRNYTTVEPTTLIGAEEGV